MRFNLLGASAALAFGLALSACSSSTGTSPSLASPSTSQDMVTVKAGGHDVVTRLMPGVKRMATSTCPSIYVFCISVTAGNAGPYVQTSAGSGYELYNDGWITRAKTGKIDKKFKDYFSPDPGNPTYQYIDFKGKAPKKTQAVRYSDYYCIGFSPSSCTGSNYTFIIGVAVAPA